MKNVSISEALEMLIHVSGVPDVVSTSTFGALALDSLQAVEWLTMLEDELGAEFDLGSLNFNEFNDLTVNEVLVILHKQLEDAQS